MLSTRRFVIMAMFGIPWAVNGDVILVDEANCPGPGGGTEGDPYCSIQTAIDNAVDGDEIVVAPGTYFESIDFLGKAITVRSSDGPEVTTIDAGGLSGAGSVVVCESGEGSHSVLQAFTVTGGHNFRGGGMRNDGTSPTVIGCNFLCNTAQSFDGFGGGMYNFGGSPTIIDCTFEDNLATGVNGGLGGGMYNDDSRPTMISCTFRGNLAPLTLGAGGGIFNNNSNPVLINCLFDANDGSSGGGMYNAGSSPMMVNCTFAANIVGAMISGKSSNPTVTNSIFWANEEGQIFDSASSTTTISYSNIQGGWLGAGSNNIDADPLPVSISNCCVRHAAAACDDPGCATTVCNLDPFCCDVTWDLICAGLASDLCSVCPNDARLQPGSPCIDAGSNEAVPSGVLRDLAGNPRHVADACAGEGGATVDMGAYEFQGTSCNLSAMLLLLAAWGDCAACATCLSDFDGDCSVGILDLLILLGNWG